MYKMYGSNERNKDTLHISPHIQAHKSSSSSVNNVSQPDSEEKHELTTYHAVSSNPGAMVSVLREPVDDSILYSRLNSRELSGVGGVTLPQDLSAHGGAGEREHRPLPHIYTVVNQGGISAGTIFSASERSYFRSDSSLQGAMLVPTSMESGNGSILITTNHSNDESPSPHGTATTLAPLVPSISNTHGEIILSDIAGVTYHIANRRIGDRLEPNQNELTEDGNRIESRDLVRQAFQAAVNQHTGQKTGHDQEVIEYSYTAGDIAELLKNIQASSSLQAINITTSSDGLGQVIMLGQPLLEEPLPITPSPPNNTGAGSKRRRLKLTDDALVERRVRVACRMRYKRASETEEQRAKRRVREAERMRRKRSAESEEQRRKRRGEAAARARHRRASMSAEERSADRRRAAERMRLRRATEDDGQKSARRVKSAERMRRRRASETPEQRASRRHILSQRMKRRLCLDDQEGEGDQSRSVGALSDDGGSMDLVIPDTAINLQIRHHHHSVVVLDHMSVNTKEEPIQEDTSVVDLSHLVSDGGHIMSTGIGTGGNSFNIYSQADGSLPPMSINSVMELGNCHMSHTLPPMHVKGISEEQDLEEPLSLHKHCLESSPHLSELVPMSCSSASACSVPMSSSHSHSGSIVYNVSSSHSSSTEPLSLHHKTPHPHSGAISIHHNTLPPPHFSTHYHPVHPLEHPIQRHQHSQ